MKSGVKYRFSMPEVRGKMPFSQKSQGFHTGNTVSTLI